MRVIAFDLSSVCIGCVVADVDKKVLKIASCPIIPEKFNPETLGYLKSKGKLRSKNKTFLSWKKKGEVEIPESEKKKRDSEVRQAKDLFLLKNISEQITEILSLSPDLVIVEKNEIFNGILTSVLLAKIMGVLQGICGSKSIPVKEYKVAHIRSKYNVSKLVLSLAESSSKEELQKIPDVSKRAIRKMLSQKYPTISFQTDDESDACLVFDYWLNYDRE